MTFEDLKSAVGDWLGKDTTQLSDTVRGQLINMAMRDLLRSYDLRFGEYAYSLSTADGTSEYTAPTGYSRTYSMWYMDGATLVRMQFLTKEEFDKRFDTNLDEDAPGYYTVWGNKLYLGPCPDAIYTVYWNIRRMLTDLVDGSPNNSNDMTVWAWEVLLLKALAMASKYLFEDARAPLWAEEAKRAESALVREHSMERSTHRRPVTAEPG